LTSDGFNDEVRVVVVGAGLTVCETFGELPAEKF